MEFILNKNAYGLIFDEEMFYWELNGDDEVSQEDVLEAAKSKIEFNKLFVATYDDEPVTVELANGIWDVDVNIMVLKDDKKRTGGKYYFHIGFYAMDRNEEYDDYECNGAMTEFGKFITADSEQEAFDMIVTVFDSLLSRLEDYCSDEEDEEDEE